MGKPILIFGDTHFPAHHPDAIDFLAEVKSVYKTQGAICTGDLIDHHASSFHMSDPDLPGAGDEIDLAIKKLRPLYELFPFLEITEDDNHTSMFARKAFAAGIPRRVIRPNKEVYEYPTGWQTHKNGVLVTLANGNKCLVTHYRGANALSSAIEAEMSIIQGHYHKNHGVKVYVYRSGKIIFGADAGSLTDKNHPAMAYARNFAKRPRNGCLVLREIPIPVPMLLDEHGRWSGKVNPSVS